MANMRKEWNTTAFMSGVQGRSEAFLKVVALRAKDIGRTQFQGIAPEHSDPGEYPAEQTGSMKQAFDAEVFQRGMRPIARFGVFGAPAHKKPPKGSTPIGQYAYDLAVGDPSRNLEPRPWHRIVIEILKAEGWADLA